MDDSEKVGLIKRFFAQSYPESEIVLKHDFSRGLHSFYLNDTPEGRLIFKISEECIEDNNIDYILEAIKSRAIDVLESNPGQEVLLYKNFNIEVNDL